MDMDKLIAELRDAPVPSRLAEIDADVMSGLWRLRDTRAARRGVALAGVIAVFVGMAASVVPGAPAEAGPLLGVPDAAPSHLLAD